ncbi:hypothetical protein BJX96DRAFT_151389 [Aspergillus floccosus]
MPSLPGEVILQVVESLIPKTSRKIYRPKDIETQTLIGLTLACKLTHQLARRILFRHCLYIDSRERLDSLLDKSGYFANNDASTPDHQCIQAFSLLLAPFPQYSLEEPHIVHQIDRLFGHVFPTLQNLVIDMPLRSLYPDEDAQGVRKVLRAAFCRLAALEDFCSVQDELFLDSIDRGAEPEVWTTWPRLRRLALYNPDVEGRFVDALHRCPNLTHLVIARPDSYMCQPLSINESSCLPLTLQRLLVLNTRDGRLSDVRVAKSSEWEASFWNCMMHSKSLTRCSLCYVDVPVPTGREDDGIDLCQVWLRAHAVDGALWEFPGTTYPADYMNA